MNHLKKVSIEELWSRYSAGERNFTHLDLTRARFEGKNFEGVDFTGCDFSRAMMSRCALVDCCLSETRFIKTRMVGIEIESCCAENAFFRKCDMRALFVAGDCIWDGGKLEQYDLRGLRTEAATLGKMQLIRCEIDGSGNVGSRCQQLQLTECSIRGCVFNECSMNDVLLSGCDLRGSDFLDIVGEYIQMINCDFNACRIIPTRIAECICQDTRMPDGSLKSGEFMWISEIPS